MEQIKHYKLSITITIAIILLSLLPLQHETPLDNVPFIDKWVHMTMYAALTLALWIDMRGYRQHLPWTHTLAMFILPSAIGGLLELAQAYCTTYRSGEWLDAAADTIGAAVMTGLCYIITILCQTKNSAQK